MFGPGRPERGGFGGHFGEAPHGGGRGGHFGGGRGGGRRRLFGNDALRLILLKLIADAPRHGYDLIRELRARGHSPHALPAVALTAFARAEDRRDALLAGYQLHLAKPADPQEIVAAVASLAGRNVDA